MGVNWSYLNFCVNLVKKFFFSGININFELSIIWMFVNAHATKELKPSNVEDLTLFLNNKWKFFRENNKALIKEKGSDKEFYPGTWGVPLEFDKADPSSTISS